MFENSYKREIEKISADKAVKENILKSLEKEPKRRKIYPRLVPAVALAVCCTIALTTYFSGIEKPEKTVPKVSEEKVSYSDIFETVNKIKNETEYAIGTGIELYATDAGTSSGNAIAKAETETADEVNNSGNNSNKSDEISPNNNQVEGVDESDIIKTDGKYIYVFSYEDNNIRIIRAGKNPKLVKKIKISSENFKPVSEMYLKDDRLIIMGYSYIGRAGAQIESSEDMVSPDISGYYGDFELTVLVYDVSVPAKAEKLYTFKQSGRLNTSRLIGDKLYLITNYGINVSDIEKDKPQTYVPYVASNDYNGIMKAESITYTDSCSRPEYTVICGFDISNGELKGEQAVLGGTYTVYCSGNNIITCDYSINSSTNVSRFEIEDGNIEFKAKGTVEGDLLNQFSIDEYNGYFRFVTTKNEGIETVEDDFVSYEIKQTNAVYILDKELKTVGKIENIAPDERVYSVRFMGDYAYFVTFRQVDPLFTADLSNPEKPKLIGALKIPGFSNYLFPYGEGKLLGLGQDANENTGATKGIKLSIFNTENPADVKEEAKLVLDSDYSSALYNHKETLVDYKRNLIGLPVWGNNGCEYRIFTLKKGKLTEIKRIKVEDKFELARGIYINDEFYLITNSSISVYDMESFEKIAKLKY